MNKNSFAVLVVSCDRYSDLWRPFFELFRRFWPECPYCVYLLSNKTNIHFYGVKNILTIDDLSWSDSLRTGITQLSEEYVILFLDDLFLYDFVKSSNLELTLNWMVEAKANYVRLNPSQPPDKKFNELVGIVSKGTIYRTSTVLSVWKKSVLLGLLKPGESAWDFEMRGTERSDAYDGFYSSWCDIFPVVNMVIKGKWERTAVRRIGSLIGEISLCKRQMMTPFEEVMFHLKWQITHALNLFPARYRRKLKYLVGKKEYNLSKK